MRDMDPRVGEPTDRQPGNDLEQRWLRAFQQGDTAAFQPLILPHLPALAALALWVVAAHAAGAVHRSGKLVALVERVAGS